MPVADLTLGEGDTSHEAVWLLPAARTKQANALRVPLSPMARAVSAVLPGPVHTRIFTDAPGSDGAGIAHHRAAMEQALANFGMGPVDAGEMILDQIAAGAFWITTHPDMLAQSAQTRANYLATLARPYLSPDAKPLLGDA